MFISRTRRIAVDADICINNNFGNFGSKGATKDQCFGQSGFLKVKDIPNVLILWYLDWINLELDKFSINNSNLIVSKLWKDKVCMEWTFIVQILIYSQKLFQIGYSTQVVPNILSSLAY